MKKEDKKVIINSTAEFLTFAYQNKQQGIEVRVQDGNIWLSQKNIGLLFETTAENVITHIQNIFETRELQEVATTKFYLVVQKEGNREVKREILTNAGKITTEIAKQKAINEFELFRPIQDRNFESDFDKMLKEVNIK